MPLSWIYFVHILQIEDNVLLLIKLSLISFQLQQGYHKGLVNPEIITKYLKKKNKALEKARVSANESTKANRRVKLAFYNTVNTTMNNPSISPKKKFQILLKLMKNNKFSQNPPLIENDLTINDAKQKSEIFNTFFASKSSVLNDLDDPPFLQKIENVPSLEQINTSPIEIAKLIRGLKKSHMSQCGIPSKFLCMISQPISYSLSKLMNNLFEIGHFPDIWKIAHVTPIFKRTGHKNDKANFRPISILPTLSKVCESVIHERLLSHCMRYKIISERQSAYLKGDSTMSQLLYIVHFIRSNWGTHNIVQGAFLDISAAFDKV